MEEYIFDPQFNPAAYIPSESASNSDTSSSADEFPINMKHLSPQDAIDQFWDRFNSKTPGKAFTILPQNIYAKKVSDSIPKGVINGQYAFAGYAEAVELCKAKVEKIVKECKRINQKYRDPHFDIEFDLKWGRRDCLETLPIPNKKKSDFKPQSVKRVADIFDAPQFYIGGATVDDIRQGRNGDCWFMAALCVLGNKQSLIERVCVARDEQVGVYGFVFHRDGDWRTEVIDDKLYLSKPDYDESFLERLIWDDRERISSEEDYRKIYQSNSGALYFAQCEDPNETWLPLLEKAYAKAHGDFSSIEGGFTGEAIEDLTGGVTTEIFTTDILDKEHFWKEELLKVNVDFLFSCCTGLFKGWGERKGIQEGHAYSIMKAVEVDGIRLLLLKNPWGRGEWTGPWSDGSKEWTAEWLQKLDHRFGNDGAFWISFEDLLRKYQSFDRTRLFTSEWKVTQQWTTLQVPWTIDYHDTKFEIVLEKDAPVVIVLSQLDERYFKGLEGQYRFELWFRLHKAGEEDYIVRSHGNYCMRRSVSVELQLEKGKYHVLMKIRSERDTCCADPVEKVVKDNCKTRRDKLLRIGLSYDLAHSRGVIVETDAENKARETAEKNKKAKERDEVKESIMKSRNRGKHLSNKEKKKGKARNAKQNVKDAAKTAKTVKPEAATEMVLSPEMLEKPTVKAEEDSAESSAETGATAAKKTIESSQKSLEEKTEDDAPPKADKLPPTQLPVPTPMITGDDCFHCRSSTTTSPKTSPISQALTTSEDSDSDTESVASSATTGTIESEIARKKEESEKKICPNSPPCQPQTPKEEEDEFQKDPWNAWCVVGLRVYSKNAECSVQVIRPKNWDDGATSLDVDDSAADATKVVGEEVGGSGVRAVELAVDGGGDAGKVDSRKASLMGVRGSIGGGFAATIRG